tara:strand:+ start:1374 stop:2294 length:921 start_codon:yes stop_codon:yes gene_type:complete
MKSLVRNLDLIEEDWVALEKRVISPYRFSPNPYLDAGCEAMKGELSKLRGHLSRIRGGAQLTSFKRLLPLLKNNAEGEATEFVNFLQSTVAFPAPHALSDIAALRLARTSKLQSIAYMLGEIYFCFGFTDFNYISELDADKDLWGNKEGIRLNLPGDAYEMEPDSLLSYLRQDTELYTSIISEFLEEEQRAPRSVKPQPPQKEIEPPTPLERLETAIDPRSFNLSEDTRERIQYFIEDITNLDLTPDQLNELGSAFEVLNLPKNINKDRSATDLKTRTFFDDLTFGYLRQGTIPSATELRELYTSA